MTNVFVSAQSPDKWDDDLVYHNGVTLAPTDPRRQEMHSLIQPVLDRGTTIISDSRFDFRFLGSDVYGCIFTDSVDRSGRVIPVVFIINEILDGSDGWVSHLFSGLYGVFEETGFIKPENLEATINEKIVEDKVCFLSNADESEFGFKSIISRILSFVVDILKNVFSKLMGR